MVANLVKTYLLYCLTLLSVNIITMRKKGGENFGECVAFKDELLTECFTKSLVDAKKQEIYNE